MATLNGQTFTAFNTADDIVTDRQAITTGLWSGGSGTLLTVYTSSVQTASSGQYYIDVYNVATSSTTQTPEVQFAIAYGHYAGSGSLKLNEQYPTRAVYSQYKNVLLTPTDDYFTIDGTDAQHIMVINFQRARIRQKLDPGNWQFSMLGTNGRTYTVIDDSGLGSAPSIGISGRVYNVVSGTIAGGQATNNETFGLCYPDVGLIVLDPDKLYVSASVSCSATSPNINESNHVRFLRAMSGSMSAGSGFIARNEEEVVSTHYFVRAKNREFNFSNNPTFVTGTLGDFWNSNMYKNPTVYITTIGLYNDNNELLAVAKLSQPLKKTFTRESLIRVKLDF